MSGFKWALLLLAVVVHCVDQQVSSHVIPIYGNATFGYFYINIYVGNPAQEQSVIIDTGSPLLALPCTKCVYCGSTHINPHFDLRKSQSNKIINCQLGYEICKSSCNGRNSGQSCTFHISYAEGSSLSGIIIEDDIRLQRETHGQFIRVPFGCTTRQTNLFLTQAANGIFGLAPQRKSRLLQSLYQKYSKQTGEQLMFSICLASNGGQLIVGRRNQNLHSGKNPIKIGYTSDKNLYTLKNVGRIRVNQTDVRTSSDSLGYYGMFIDTGSTFTYFPHQVFKKFKVQIENSCANHPQSCKIAQGAASICFRIEPLKGKNLFQTLGSIFPSIDVQLGGQFVKWKPQEYFLMRSKINKQICMGLQPLDRFLLGGNWMVNRDIVFDLGQKTVQIYNQVQCSLHPQRQVRGDLMTYTGVTENENPLVYIQAVFQQKESIITKILWFILILMGVLTGLVIVSQRCQPRRKEILKKVPDQENRQITETAVERHETSNEVIQITMRQNGQPQNMVENAEEQESV